MADKRWLIVRDTFDGDCNVVSRVYWGGLDIGWGTTVIATIFDTTNCLDELRSLLTSIPISDMVRIYPSEIGEHWER